MPKKAGDFIREAMRDLPGLQELEAKTLYSQALRYLYGKHRWRFLLQNDIISTEAPYETGTVAVTNGSASVVGSGTTWSAAWANRRIVIDGQSQVYDLLVSSATAATLQAGGVNKLWPGVTGSALTYRIFRDIYPLSSNCDWGKDFVWWDPEQNIQLDIIDPVVMLTEKATVPGTLGRPYAVARAPLSQSTVTTAPVANVEFGIYVPDAVYTFQTWYFRKPVVATSDNDYPLWPEEYEDLIRDRMRIDYANNPRHRIPLSPQWLEEYRLRLWECMKRNDGGAEISRRRQRYRDDAREPFQNFNIANDTNPFWTAT